MLSPERRLASTSGVTRGRFSSAVSVVAGGEVAVGSDVGVDTVAVGVGRGVSVDVGSDVGVKAAVGLSVGVGVGIVDVGAFVGLFVGTSVVVVGTIAACVPRTDPSKEGFNARKMVVAIAIIKTTMNGMTYARFDEVLTGGGFCLGGVPLTIWLIVSMAWST